MTPLVIPAKHAVVGRPTSDRVKPIAAIVAAKANPATIDAGPLRNRRRPGRRPDHRIQGGQRQSTTVRRRLLRRGRFDLRRDVQAQT
jgi:hypothetical protein